MTDYSRPCIGLIVEGHDEYNSFPSFVCRILATHINVPVVNAAGYGNITKHLHEQLDALVCSDHPCTILICIDLREIVTERIFDNCISLLNHLCSDIALWQKSRSTHTKFHPLPDAIIPIIQIPAFESWLLADLDGLMKSGVFGECPSLDRSGNVDVICDNPSGELWRCLRNPADAKSPKVAKTIVSSLDVNVIVGRSRSFQKFYKEVRAAYSRVFPPPQAV